RFVIRARGGRVVGGPVVGGGILPACRAFTAPLVDPALLAPVAVTPGTTDLRVRRRTLTAPMPAASYGRVVVGKGSLLQLAGGSYAARSIRVAPSGRLVCADACRIGVLERVVLAPRAELGAGGRPRAQARTEPPLARVAQGAELRMPLDGEHEGMLGRLDRLDDVVGAPGDGPQPLPEAADGLMVHRLHDEMLRLEEGADPARRVDPHLVLDGQPREPP